MAVDVALLDDAVRLGTASLRLYRWDPPTLSIGRNQTLTVNDVPVVRRPTGGQAVWHEHELTYAVAAPIATFGSSVTRTEKSTLESRWHCVPGSRRCAGGGRPAVRPSDRPTSCSRPPSAVNRRDGRKLVGSAQVRRGGAFLQHARSCSMVSGQSAGGTGETTLAVVLGRAATFEEVAAAVSTIGRTPYTVDSPTSDGPRVHLSLRGKC